jgi:hypothetical protein
MHTIAHESSLRPCPYVARDQLDCRLHAEGTSGSWNSIDAAHLALSGLFLDSMASRIQSFREVLLEDGKNLSEHAIDRMFLGQFCIKDWRSCANLEPSLARRLQPHPFCS